MRRHATVFLDRDDTLIVDSGFIDDPAKVELVPGAGEAVRRLHAAGFKVVVASNQSGVARGRFDEERLRKIHARLQQLLEAEHAPLDGIYYCPYLDGPEAVVAEYRRKSSLRKPAPGMLLKAAREMDLDLSRSWMIGDSARDVQAGQAAGCETILVGDGVNGEGVEPTYHVGSLLEAVDIVEQEADVAPSMEGGPAMPRNAETTSVLTEIRDLLEWQHREDRHRDFSILHLIASLVQMLALMAAGWGVWAMFANDASSALTRFALAGFLQLLMITVVSTDRKR